MTASTSSSAILTSKGGSASNWGSGSDHSQVSGNNFRGVLGLKGGNCSGSGQSARFKVRRRPPRYAPANGIGNGSIRKGGRGTTSAGDAAAVNLRQERRSTFRYCTSKRIESS